MNRIRRGTYLRCTRLTRRKRFFDFCSRRSALGAKSESSLNIHFSTPQAGTYLLSCQPPAYDIPARVTSPPHSDIQSHHHTIHYTTRIKRKRMTQTLCLYCFMRGSMSAWGTAARDHRTAAGHRDPQRQDYPTTNRGHDTHIQGGTTVRKRAMGTLAAGPLRPRVRIRVTSTSLWQVGQLQIRSWPQPLLSPTVWRDQSIGLPCGVCGKSV